jgi:hypothetical protein
MLEPDLPNPFVRDGSGQGIGLDLVLEADRQALQYPGRVRAHAGYDAGDGESDERGTVRRMPLIWGRRQAIF